MCDRSPAGCLAFGGAAARGGGGVGPLLPVPGVFP